jgi:hypothetical protein
MFCNSIVKQQVLTYKIGQILYNLLSVAKQIENADMTSTLSKLGIESSSADLKSSLCDLVIKQLQDINAGHLSYEELVNLVQTTWHKVRWQPSWNGRFLSSQEWEFVKLFAECDRKSIKTATSNSEGLVQDLGHYNKKQKL